MNYWLGLAINDVRALGFSVIDSSGEYATKQEFFSVMNTHSPDVIIADGHGDPSTLTGQSVREVLTACTNNQVLSGKVVCALSCLTGQRLGPDSRDKNASAYVGFTNEFTWEIDPINPYPPTDVISYAFQEVVRKMVVSTCRFYQKQSTLREAYDAIASEFSKWEAYYSSPPGSEIKDGVGSPRAADILFCLRHDKNGVITLGKEETILSEVNFPVGLISIGLGILTSFFL